MGVLHRSNCHGKENSCLLDDRAAPGGRPGGQHLGDQSLLVEFSQVQSLQSLPESLGAQSPGRIRACVPALLQVCAECGLITTREEPKLVFHAFPNSRATRSTFCAEVATNRFVLAISLFSPLTFARACCFNDIKRTLMPSKVWATSSWSSRLSFLR